MTVTRADVAALAGVSPALVSYVINGGPRPVSPEARRRVESAIEQLGYRPNAIASALRGGLSRTVALLVGGQSNPYYAELSEVIGEELFEHGYALTVAATKNDPRRETVHIQAALARRVDGFIVTSAQAARTLRRVSSELIPIVAVDLTEANHYGASSVVSGSAASARRATEHLQSHGHRLIGCVTGDRSRPAAAERVNGWREQQVLNGASAAESLVAYAPFSMEGGYEAAIELLDLRVTSARCERPTALMVASDVQATGVLAACADLGLRVPDDVAVASLDGTQFARFTRPSLTSVRQPLADMAHVLVEMLLDRVAHPDLPPAQVVLEGNLVIGRSCGCDVSLPGHQ